MKKRFWGWRSVGVGCVVIMIGCGGSPEDGAKGGAGNVGAAFQETPAGAGNDSPSSPESGADASGVPGVADSAPCVGELAKVAAGFGDCPATLSAAQVSAESCGSLENGEATKIGTCDMLRVITFKWVTHGKDCYYDLGSVDADPKLIGAAKWDDTPSYCNGTSSRIEAGKTTANCGAFTDGSTVVCDMKPFL